MIFEAINIPSFYDFVILGWRENRVAAHLEPIAIFPSDYSANQGETSF